MGKKVFISLSHPFSAEIPRWPYFDKPIIDNAHTMAKGGVLTQKITCTMHTGTHCDAPRHVMEIEFDGKRARYTHEMPIYQGTQNLILMIKHSAQTIFLCIQRNMKIIQIIVLVNIL